MAIQQKTVNIKGQEYLLNTIPALAGTRILKQLIKLGGPAFAAFQSGANEEGENTPESMSLAVTALLENLDSVGVEQLIVDLVSSAHKDRQSINFNVEFAGEYDKLFLLVKEIVEFNFGSVFTLFGSDVN